MPRFHVRYPVTQEGQKHDPELFATDNPETVKTWLGPYMYDSFVAVDEATGAVMSAPEDVDAQLAVVPAKVRDWSACGSIDDLDDDLDDWLEVDLDK